MDSVVIGKMGSALIFIAPACFLLYCFLHEKPKTPILEVLKWVTVVFSIVSIFLGFKLLLG